MSPYGCKLEQEQVDLGDKLTRYTGFQYLARNITKIDTRIL